MSTIANKGFVGRLIVTAGFGFGGALVKESYGEGAPIDAAEQDRRYTFYAETDLRQPALVDPPTANTTQT